MPVSIEENSTIESTNSPNRSDSKRKFFEVEAASTDDDDDGSESEDETLTSQIERLALEKSIDDPDFNVSYLFPIFLKKIEIYIFYIYYYYSILIFYYLLIFLTI